MRKIIIIFLLAVLALLIAIAAYDPLRDAVRNGLVAIGGETYAALENGWTGIAATPAYQSYHMFIWFIGGGIFVFLLTRLHSQGKLPLLKPKTLTQPQMMGAPATVIIQEAPKPTKTTKTTEPNPTPNPSSQQDQPAATSES